MPINDPYASQSSTRTIGLQVLSNGMPLLGIVSAEVTTGNHYQCDRFNLTVATSASPTPWWDTEPPLEVDIQVNIDGAAWFSILQGEIDTVRWTVQRGVLSASGRDLSARLIEKKTTNAYLNQTASQVATSMAVENGLTPVVTATTTLVTRYYQTDHTRVSLGQFSKQTTEWDMLVFLAQQEGFDVFVRGTSLYFQPSTPPNADPYLIVYTPPGPQPYPVANVISLELERSYTLAKDIQVDVMTWSSRSKSSNTASVKASGTKSASASPNTSSGSTSSSNTTQRYVFIKPNLTHQQALAFAQQMLTEMSKHERIVTVTMPGDLLLTGQNLVQLQGTGGSWDQVYFVDSITRSFSFERGFTQRARLKNTSPRSQAVLQ